MRKFLAVHGGLCLALALAAGAARAQVPVLPEEPYPAEAQVERAEAKAKAASSPCESELKAKHAVGAACGRYHAAVLDALQREHQRFAWCNTRMSETTGVPVFNDTATTE